ncbi:MAG TPA: GntR family transcriptional regulator [Nocardioides sp.]|jgi:DNA-binding GntR family transcriptional regulator|uniref:GntR family transcriptional regulator n=1 Tax=Nocardioides sp. TaxID=35761 RepID=UPI002E316B5B|nr:GntR family transcriptional regulator [Nocardioides sp.]HEX3931051.1 GntR family transcriptional regulator [Nocardioides sp.]
MSSTEDPRRVDAGSVADAIRERIATGAYAPGQRLVEADLIEEHGVGRGAVRTALIQLEQAGLVERVANRGARVRMIEIDEAVRLMEVRMVVEGLCAAKAAENATPADIRELRAIASAMTQAVGAGEPTVYSNLNAQLHDTVRRIADQHVATEVLLGLQARNVRHQFRLAMRPGRPQVSLPEHLALIDEICAKDPGAADRAARRHVASVIEAMRA